MKSDYWNVPDEKLIEATGHPGKHWLKVLKGLDASTRKSNDVIADLQSQHGISRYWARTLHTRFKKSEAGEL